ncbi:MAG: Uma2 family endonuclease [Oscillospiraceae bacterium]|nr:Uma2 family endonuclease [Oscillospiraceae bacterium]
MSEQVLRFPGNYPDSKFKEEKIDGKIYRMATPCGEHMDIQNNLGYIFTDYFRRHKKPCRSRQDSRINIDEKNYLVPDIQILCRENSNGEVPVIVIEVLSKSTRKRDYGDKMRKYEKLGIKEYWIIIWEIASLDIFLLNEDKKYEIYNSYALYTEEELKKDTELSDEEKKYIAREFSPVSFPEMIVKLEDVFDIWR